MYLWFAVGVTSAGVAKTVPVVKRTDNALTVLLVTMHGHSENLPMSISDSTLTCMVELHECETETPINPLPTFSLSSYPTFDWGEMNGKTFSRALNGKYSEIVHWTRNLFEVPSGKAGTAFVRELSRLFRAYAGHLALESVAMKAAMVMPALLLQKLHLQSRAKDHVIH